MKFSEAWLREWVDPGCSRDELVAQLTMAGLEVDGVAPAAAEFSGVVVGEVVDVQPHPDADKLRVCTVNDGTESVQVVCGAPNARAGMKSAFARVGAVLPGDFRIKRAKLRGVESRGMLCSGAELQINADDGGILDLAAELNVGDDLRDALRLHDVTIELDLTPNRGDCLSLKGIAREVGVLYDREVRYPEIVPVPAQSDATFPVQLVDGAGCPRYLGRVIEGVDVTRPTPAWMVERLERCGLRSIDPIVDITNYVMLELGQPMHAFDLDVLRGGIVVRGAAAGETLRLLDGQQVELDADTLLITDDGGPVAIAGVMGGERSGIQPGTRNVFLECAYFAPLAVAGTARRFGLHTDASQRYERGVDFALQFDAVERATGLLLEVVGGAPGPMVEAVAAEHLPTPAEVTVREQRLNALLGIDIDAAEVDTAFRRLGFELVRRDAGDAAAGASGTAGVSWTIRAPSHRFDIALEADLVEEVCRIYGYNNIPSKSPTTALALREVPLDTAGVPALKAQMAAAGFQEVITYSFIDPALQDMLEPGSSPLTLANPMSQEQSVMRGSLLPGLVSALTHNIARQQQRVRLFEVGQVFRTHDGVLTQPNLLGGVLWGNRGAESWHEHTDGVDFFDAKGAVERLLQWSGGAVQFEPASEVVLHPGQSAWLVAAGQRIGRVGRLHPEIESRLDLATPAFVFEIDAEFALAQRRRHYQGLSRQPLVRRDLSLLVARDVPATAIETLIRDLVGSVLVDFRLFDVYQGKGIDSNEKSLGVGLTFQHPSATLTDAEVSAITERVVARLASEFGARLR